MNNLIDLRNFQAIFFDLDGTLIDSMEIHYFCWSKILKEYDISIKKDDFYLNEGRNIYSLMSSYSGLRDLDSIMTLIKKKDDLFNQLYRFELYTGVVDFFQYLMEFDLKLGLVTASSESRLKATIPAWFRNYFTVAVTSDDGGRGKPFSDPYEIAATKASVDSRRSLAIENAPLGVTSAKSAGMTTVALAHTLDKSILAEANYIYSSFVEFYEEIKHD